MRIAYGLKPGDSAVIPTTVGEFCMVYVDGYNIMGKLERAGSDDQILYTYAATDDYHKKAWQEWLWHMIDGVIRTFRAKPDGILDMCDLWMSASNAQTCRDFNEKVRPYDVE